MIALMMAAALAQASAAPAPLWHSVVRAGRAEALVDEATVRRDGDAFEASVRLIFSTVQTTGERSTITRYRFDCARRTLAPRHLAAFDDAGSRIMEFAVTGDNARPRTVEPGSPGEAVLARYCAPPDATKRGE